VNIFVFCVAADITDHPLTPCISLKKDVYIMRETQYLPREIRIHIHYEDQLARAL
jgi:hypothetical protein